MLCVDMNGIANRQRIRSLFSSLGVPRKEQEILIKLYLNQNNTDKKRIELDKILIFLLRKKTQNEYI